MPVRSSALRLSRPRAVATLVAACALAAVAGSGCAAAIAQAPPPPSLDAAGPRRFYRVDAGVYRSGQPSAAELRHVAGRYRIRTVIKLNAGSDDAPDGVRVVHARLDALLVPSRATLDSILDTIDRAEKPVLIHCTHGEDRTGLIVALYRIRHGARAVDAYADMVQRGFHPYRGVWRAFTRAVGW